MHEQGEVADAQGAGAQEEGRKRLGVFLPPAAAADAGHDVGVIVDAGAVQAPNGLLRLGEGVSLFHSGEYVLQSALDAEIEIRHAQLVQALKLTVALLQDAAHGGVHGHALKQGKGGAQAQQNILQPVKGQAEGAAVPQEDAAGRAAHRGDTVDFRLDLVQGECGVGIEVTVQA